MITLNVNKFLGALTNLIAYAQIAYTTDRGQVGEFVNSFEDINVANGDGKVVLSADFLNVNDLSAQSTLLQSNPPTVNEQYVSVENYKVIPVTVNQYLMRNAFVNEEQLANFVGYIKSLMETTRTAYLSDELIKEIEAYTPTQATQTVTVHTIDTTNLTDPMQLESANRYNANALQKAFIKTLQAMSFPTNKYNDLAYKEVMDFSSLKLVIRANEDVDIVVDSLAYLLNSDKITEAQRWGKTFVVPSEQFTNTANQFVAWLMHYKKIQFGYFYEVATSFFDASTLNQNDWLHFAYYLDTINAYPCVCFKLEADIKPSALGTAEVA